MMAENTKFLFAISFLLLSIFATYCPIPRLFSHVKAAERREALCREGEYYDSGPGRCQSCDIPCKTSEQVCRDLQCYEYYSKHVKSKKELCKPDEFYEKSIERCRPCSIPCSVNDKLCQEMGCAISSPLPTSDLPRTRTAQDTSVSPIFAKTTAAPDKTDPPKFSMGTVIACSIIASLVVTGLTGLFVFLGNYLHAKYIEKGRRKKLTQWQRRVLAILEICHRTYERVVPTNTRNSHSDAPFNPAEPDGDREPTRGTTLDHGANPAEDGSTPGEGNHERVPLMQLNEIDENRADSADAEKSPADIKKEQLAPGVAGGGLNLLHPRGSIPTIDDFDDNSAGDGQSDAAAANVNGPPSDNQQNYKEPHDMPDGHPKHLKQTPDATPAEGADATPAEGGNHRPFEHANIPSKGTTRPATVAIPAKDPTNIPLTVSEVNEKRSALNASLVIELDKSLGEKKLKTLLNFFRGAHGIPDVRVIEKAESVAEIIDYLIRNKKIQMDDPNGYNLLIGALEQIDEHLLADQVRNYQSQIFEAGNP